MLAKPSPVADDCPVTALQDCEQALVGHWTQLGRLPGCTLHDDDGLVFFETPVRHIPFNAVVRTKLAGGTAADRAIESVLARMRERDANVWWMVHPSATPTDLGGRLAAAGLSLVEEMSFMALDLEQRDPTPLPPGVEIAVADDEAARRTYLDLTLSYWEIPPAEADVVADLHLAVDPERRCGVRHLAFVDGQPVGKGYLSLTGPPGVAGIYGMSVRPQARGRGVAAALTASMIGRALELGCHRVVLHATEMAVGLYRRAGFEHVADAAVYATAPVWTDP